MNVQYTIEKLFEGDFGIGYPPEVATRQVKEIARVKTFNTVAKRNIVEVLSELDDEVVNHMLMKEDVSHHVLTHTTNEAIKQFIQMKIK